MLMCPDGSGGVRAWINEAENRHDHFCTSEGSLEPNVYVDHSNYRSLDNWISDMDLYWKSGFQISLFGSVFFFGVLFCAIGLKFANSYGRKPVLIFGCWVSSILTIGLVFINNMIMRYILMFLYGVWFF